ncbi:EAL domain-containing protein [Jeotgalibaca porci]|uniref:bifunctional diguanylate cyclase/phosphodiesterase n=1 Tax=Jeotgalibaca porci TaxID=1868793 RepID=UPI0035A17D8C
MLFDKKGSMDEHEAHDIIENVVAAGDIGLFSWHMDTGTFELIEHISGYRLQGIHSLPDFLERYVFPKDLEIALQDLNNYLNGKEEVFQSTFRVLDSKDKMHWVFCKSTIMGSNKLAGLIYDVSANKMLKGNDYTTNLVDAKYLTRKLGNAIQNKQKENSIGALLYLEIDNLHSLINHYGFKFGSIVLYQMSRILLNFTSGKDEVSRFPNDKFMLLIDNVTSNDEIKNLGKKIIKMLEAPLIVEGLPVYLNVSIGMTLFPDADKDAIELIRQSDFAISHSKEQGSNRASFFDTELMETFNRGLQIESELANALNNDEFYLVYQPQLNVVDNIITGFEVLLRWNNKRLGFVSPAEFIPVAEEKGYIVKTGRWLLQETIKTARSWIDLGLEFGTLSINVSPVELFQKDFRERLLETCGKYDVPPEKIKIEITERTVMNSNAKNITIINDLLADGFKIALDDFGMGYSNFNFLFEFEITTLKLDKSLVEHIKDKKRRLFIESILKLRDYKDFDVIAEGVETKEELDTLVGLGCRQIQGYYFSQPLKRSVAEKFLRDFNNKSADAGK